MAEIAVLGATGYTGIELVRLLSGHQAAVPVFLSSESYAGQKLSDVHPQFHGLVNLKLDLLDVDDIPSSVELVFCALPHGKSASIVSALLEKGFRVIDLSADFRLKEAGLYSEWYSLEHPYPSLLDKSVYGLPELYGDEVKTAGLIANPGCYPTSIILALAPLLRENLADSESIIIDAKSGVSGAGRAPKQQFHFPDCSENFKAYRVASHQHTAEIEQELGRLAGKGLKVTFTPHLVPMARGILSTIYLELNENKQEKALRELFEEFYSNCSFVRVLPDGFMPETRYVRGSNYCDLALKADRRTGRLVVISAIDNLVKGASGQAVQNMNLMLGWPEDTGLRHLPF